MIYRLCLKAEAEPRGPCVPRQEPGNENGVVWFPGSRLGTSMIYRPGLKDEAEPRGPCVPRREPGNENGLVWFPGSRLGTPLIYRLGLKNEAEPRGPCVPRREPGNENGVVWFPGSRLGTPLIYRLRLKNEAEPREPCVPRREPGNENGSGKRWQPPQLARLAGQRQVCQFTQYMEACTGMLSQRSGLFPEPGAVQLGSGGQTEDLAEVLGSGRLRERRS